MECQNENVSSSDLNCPFLPCLLKPVCKKKKKKKSKLKLLKSPQISRVSYATDPILKLLLDTCGSSQWRLLYLELSGICCLFASQCNLLGVMEKGVKTHNIVQL